MQNKFFGMVKAVQNGGIHLDGVGKHIADAAKRMVPKDRYEVAPGTGFDVKDTFEKRIPRRVLDGVKRADIAKTMEQTRKAIESAAQTRAKRVQAHSASLAKHNDALRKKLQAAEDKVTELDAAAQSSKLEAEQKLNDVHSKAQQSLITMQSKAQASELKSQQTIADMNLKTQLAEAEQAAAVPPSLPQGQPAYGAIAQSQYDKELEANSSKKQPALTPSKM